MWSGNKNFITYSLGGIAIANGQIIQAMVKYEEKIN